MGLIAHDNDDAASQAERLIFRASYDFKRSTELQSSDEQVRILNGKSIVSARVTDRHIQVLTEDGYRVAFYGLIEIVPPGGTSVYDR